jgi:hypothetical protein
LNQILRRQTSRSHYGFQFIVNLDTWGGAGFSKRIEVGVSIYVTEYGTALTTILPILSKLIIILTDKISQQPEKL